MRSASALLHRRGRRGIRTDEIESRVSDDYHLMTLAIIAISTFGGAVVMWHNRHLGKAFKALSLATLVERAWLVWYLGTRRDPNKELAIAVDAATLATSMVTAARLSPAGQYCSPWGTIAGSSTPAYPHLGGKQVGWASTALVSVGTVLGFHLNGRGRRDITLRGLSDGLAHVRGAALSVAAASSFRAVAERLSEAAGEVEVQQVATSSAAERERLYGVIHDHTLYSLEQIAGPQPPDVETARKIAKVEAERLRLRLGVAEADGHVPWSALAVEFSAAGLHVEVEVAPEVDTLAWDPAVLAAGLAALREALRNVVKHAGSASARLVMWTDGTVLVAEVSDRGAGFDPMAVAHGYGLARRLRGVEAVGGRIAIDSAPGQGTCVRLHLPTSVQGG